MSATQTRMATDSTCWSCRARTHGEHFCPACGKIQPLPRGTDYFAFFGLPRKLRVDAAELEKRFHQLSWRLHPDNFVRAAEYERELSLDRSSQLNDAYRALRDPISRVEYLLAREGARKEGEHKQKAPPELLEEVFELNESLDELRSIRKGAEMSGGQTGDGAGEVAALRSKLLAAQKNFEEKLAEVDAELEGVAGQWDAMVDASPGPAGAGDDAARKKLMARMNEILNRRSYIRNLVAGVQKELTEA
jgi:molecular chaperone HscB